MSDSPDSPPRAPVQLPPKPPSDSARLHIANALLFLGPVIACVGMLAIMKTRQANIAFAAMAPIGLIMSLIGWVMKYRTSK